MSTESGRKLSFLLISPSFACIPITGAGQRTALIYQVLKNLGSVDILIIGDGEPQFFKSLFQGANSFHIVKPRERAELGLWRLIRPLNPKLLDFVATTFGSRKSLYQPDQNIIPFLEKLQASSNYDFVIGRYLRPTTRSGVLQFGKSPVILDVDDRDDVVYQSRLNRPDISFIHRLIFRWHFHQSQRIVADLLPTCKHIWLVSEADVREIEHPSKSILPNIPYTSDSGSEPTPFPENYNSKIILFVGSFGHRVNREGVERFVSRCWPAISSAIEGATFRIVGSGGWEELREKFNAIPNVDIIGFTGDLKEEYKQAAFTVVPLFEGGGTKIKVLESLFYQRTAVVTTCAQQGYETLSNRESLLVAADESELVKGCVELLLDFELRSRLAKTGHTRVVDKYSFNRFSSLIHETIETLCE